MKIEENISGKEYETYLTHSNEPSIKKRRKLELATEPNSPLGQPYHKEERIFELVD